MTASTSMKTRVTPFSRLPLPGDEKRLRTADSRIGMPGAAPEHRRTTAAVVVALLAALLAVVGPACADAAGPQLWAVELGSADAGISHARAGRLAAGGVNAFVVDARRVSLPTRTRFARVARAAKVRLITVSRGSRKVSGGLLLARLGSPLELERLAQQDGAVLALIRLDARTFSLPGWERAVAVALQNPRINL